MPAIRRPSPAGDIPIKKPTSKRSPGQARSIDTRNRIIEGAIQVVADHGIAGLTHRAIARAADVALASTTYHFASKSDILGAVSQAMLDDGTLPPHRPQTTDTGLQLPKGSPRSWVLQFLIKATGRQRISATCWTEIMLDAPRHPESLALARQWFAAASKIWRAWSLASESDDSELVARSYGDITVGLLLFVLVLRPTEDDLHAVFHDGEEPLGRWRRQSEGFSTQPRRLSRKSNQTREAIVAATLDELVSKGQTTIGLKSMAIKAGLSPSGAFYHFPTTASLIKEAQHRLFENAKDRYREFAPLDRRHESLDQLIDRTTAIFFREATEYAHESLAIYRVWLEASRQPSLQSAIWNDIENQHSAWRRLLTPLSSALRPVDPLLPQALFTGKLIRMVATGSQTDDLSNVRREFAYDLTRITSGNFWL